MAAETIRAILGGITPDVRRLVDTIMQQSFPNENIEIICPENIDETRGYVRLSQNDLRVRLILLSHYYFKFIEPILPDTMDLWQENGNLLEYDNLKDLEKTLKERWLSMQENNLDSDLDFNLDLGLDIDDDSSVNDFYNTDLDSLNLPFNIDDYNNALDENYKLQNEIETIKKANKGYEDLKKEIESTKKELEVAYQEIERLNGQQIQRADYAQLELSKKELENKHNRLQNDYEKLSEEIKDISRDNFRLKEELENSKTAYYEKAKQDLIAEGYVGMTSNIFAKLEQNIAPIPKVASKLNLSQNYKDIHTYFSGTERCNHESYVLLKDDILNKYSDTRGVGKDVLLLDLSPESYSQLEFGIDKPQEASNAGYEWLESLKQDLRTFLYHTKTQFCRIFYPNKGNSYNSYWLLTLDWDKIIQKLRRSGFEIYIYFGCLNTIENQVLYRTVCDTTDCNIIVSGKPTELILLANNYKLIRFSQDTRVCVINKRSDRQTETIYKKFERLHNNIESVNLKNRNG